MTEYIKRAAVFEQFDNGEADVIEMYPDGSVDFGFGASNIRDLINAIPAADVTPVVNDTLRNVWVPASDRLPAQDGQYLCLYSFPTGGHARSVLRPSVLDYYATDARPHFQYEGYRGMHVSYWMPLPPVPEVDDG